MGVKIWLSFTRFLPEQVFLEQLNEYGLTTQVVPCRTFGEAVLHEPFWDETQLELRLQVQLVPRSKHTPS
jgi:hypothetical protein